MTTSPDAVLATGEEAAWVWNLADRTVCAPWDHQEAHRVALRALVRTCTSAEWHKLKRLRATGHAERIFDAAFSTDGQRIATALRGLYGPFWDRDGRQLATLRDEGMRPAIAVVFLAAGLVTGHMDRMARSGTRMAPWP